jgi:hypothetical protein
MSTLSARPGLRVLDLNKDRKVAVAALADGDLGYLTGATLMLDGGTLLID